MASASIGVFVLTLCVMAIDRAKNRDLRFGYYGEFNAIVQALEKMPELEILDAGANHDVTLEEISITIVKDGGIKVHLNFGQNEPFRRMRGQASSTEFSVKYET